MFKWHIKVYHWYQAEKKTLSLKKCLYVSNRLQHNYGYERPTRLGCASSCVPDWLWGSNRDSARGILLGKIC